MGRKIEEVGLIVKVEDIFSGLADPEQFGTERGRPARARLLLVGMNQGSLRQSAGNALRMSIPSMWENFAKFSTNIATNRLAWMS